MAFIQYSNNGQINLSLISKHDDMNTIKIIYSNVVRNVCQCLSLLLTIFTSPCVYKNF